MTSAHPELNLTTSPVDPLDSPAMEWLAVVVGLEGADREQLLTVAECAAKMRMSENGVRDLITGGYLEAIRAGKSKSGDFRITVRTVLVHLYKSWTCRDAKTYKQAATLAMELMSGLPGELIKQTALHCVHLMRSRSPELAAALATALADDLPNSDVRTLANHCVDVLKARQSAARAQASAKPVKPIKTV